MKSSDTDRPPSSSPDSRSPPSNGDNNDDDFAPAPPNPKKSALNSADPARNFTLSMEERIRAITIGVPAWAARKRKIEDDQERYVAQLVELHDVLVAKGKPAHEIEVSMSAAAAALDLNKLNDLVVKHNKYYPIEANLPINLKGNYLVYGRVWKPEEPYTIGRFIALARAAIERRRCDHDE